MRVLALLLALAALATSAAAAGASTGFASPLFGLAVAPNGDLLVADAGTGMVPIRRGEAGTPVAILGVTDVAPVGRGLVWATTSGEDPGSGQGVSIITGRHTRQVADLYAFESAHDPDGAGVDSNPFDIEALNGHEALVADAGANDVLRVDRSGAVAVAARFPDEVVSTANLQALVDCGGTPDPEFAFLCAIDEMPAQAVPTSLAKAPDGSIYVGELKGFPAPTGESNIWRLDPSADNVLCGTDAGCSRAFDGGFTSIIDLAFGPDGKLYVAELDEASWAAVEFGGGGVGGTINACDVATGVCSEVMTGIPMLSAIAFDKGGRLWATRNALVPGLAEVFPVT